MGRQINKIASNGECLLNAIQESLKQDQGIELSDKNLSRKLFQEIKNRTAFYLQFTQNTTEMQLIQDIGKYLSRKRDTYTLPNVDLIIGAACNSLNININILQKYEDAVKEIRMVPEARPSIATIYLLFTKQENRALDPNNITAHYDSIVLEKQNPSIWSTTSTNKKGKAQHNAQPRVPTTTKFECFCHEKNLNASHPKQKFEMDMSVFDHHAWKHVQTVPFDINGTDRFEISCAAHEWPTKVKDGQFWQTSCSKNKILKGFRHVSKCRGSLCCTNEKCPRKLADKPLNTKAFNRLAGHFTCKICGYFVDRKWCGAKRALEYDYLHQILTVWHQGQHNCTLASKNETFEEKQQKKNILREIVNKNPRAPRAKLIDQGSQYYMERGEFNNAQKFVSSCTDRKILNEIRKEALNDIMSHDMHSLSAVGIIKKKSDTFDKYHIYRINDRALNSRPSFVFKSSKAACDVALEMHYDPKSKNPLQQQVAFLDGLHSRVKNYITLTLWVYNPVTVGLFRLATMEAESEDTMNITTFLRTFNDMLCEHSGNPDLVWHPSGFMTDENGANKIAIGNVFGENMRKRSVSCQWHFLRCARKQLQKIPTSLHKTFKELTQGLVKNAVSISEYTKIHNELHQIAHKYNCVRWLRFWHARRAHFVPAFRGFMLPGLNLAEPGQGAMDRQTTHILSLVDCAYKDIAFQMRQDTKYKAEINNEDVM